MKHAAEYLRFPEATVEAVTEFRQITGQVLWADAIMDTTNVAFDIGDQGMDNAGLPLIFRSHSGKIKTKIFFV